MRLEFKKRGYKKAFVYIGSLLMEYIDVDEVVGVSSLRSLDPAMLAVDM